MQTPLLQTNRKAIGSALIGIIAVLGTFFFNFGTILSIAGLLIGIMSLREMKESKQKGKPYAIAGMILNSLGIIRFFF